MPEETPEITVSHADLDAALEEGAVASEAAEETVEDEPETPEPEAEQAISSDLDQTAEPEEDDEPEHEESEEVGKLSHEEKTKLGRRFAEKTAIIDGKIDRLVDIVERFVSAAKSAPEEDPEEDEPVFMTKKQLREFVKSEARNEVVQTKASEIAAQTQYENAYVNQVRKIGADLTPKQLDVVFKEMFDHHNEIHYKIPAADADINFHRALASLEKKAQPAKKVIPLKKDDPKNLGGPADTVITGKKVASQKLDEHAAAFVKHHKLTDEQVASALSGETRPSLMGKFG